MALLSKFQDPADPDERELRRRASPEFRQYPQLDDVAARALLEQLLELRRRVLREPGRQNDARDDACEKATKLIRGVAGWAFMNLFTASVCASYRSLDLEGRRSAMADFIACQPLIPDPVRTEILRALEALRWGQTDEILQPRISRRRRKWPREAAYAELHALIWIRYQKASGSMTEQAARGAVAEAFGVGERAPEKWRAGAEKDLGVEYVAESLDEAEAEGALAAAGKPISRASQLASVLQTGLPAIAKTWKWAREPK